jgi:hypothetical protein
MVVSRWEILGDVSHTTYVGTKIVQYPCFGRSPLYHTLGDCPNSIFSLFLPFLDEPDLTIGTILVNGHCTELSSYVDMCGLGTVRNGTRK